MKIIKRPLGLKATSRLVDMPMGTLVQFNRAWSSHMDKDNDIFMVLDIPSGYLQDPCPDSIRQRVIAGESTPVVNLSTGKVSILKSNRGCFMVSDGELTVDIEYPG